MLSVVEPESAELAALTEHPPYWDSILSDLRASNYKLRRCRYVFERIDGGGRRILDYGSGMGLLACWMAAHGARQVVGVELLKDWRRSSEFLAANIFKTTNVQFVETDEALEAGSFDAAVMCNSISHISQVGRVFARVCDLLRSGGILFIEDNNNRRSLLVRRRQAKKWASTDRAYSDLRRDIDPGREAETYGLSREEIETWRRHDLSPLRGLRRFAPRDPINGTYCENWFDPQEVEVMLFNLGFAPVEHRAKHVFDFKRNVVASWVFRTFPHLSLYAAPGFEVTAVKV